MRSMLVVGISRGLYTLRPLSRDLAAEVCPVSFLLVHVSQTLSDIVPSDQSSTSTNNLKFPYMATGKAAPSMLAGVSEDAVSG